MAIRGPSGLSNPELGFHCDQHLVADLEVFVLLTTIVQPADDVVSAVADDPVAALRQGVWAAEYAAFDAVGVKSFVVLHGYFSFYVGACAPDINW